MKTSGGLFQYHKDSANNNMEDSEPFKLKLRLTNNLKNNNNTGMADVKTAVP